MHDINMNSGAQVALISAIIAAVEMNFFEQKREIGECGQRSWSRKPRVFAASSVLFTADIINVTQCFLLQFKRA